METIGACLLIHWRLPPTEEVQDKLSLPFYICANAEIALIETSKIGKHNCHETIPLKIVVSGTEIVLRQRTRNESGKFQFDDAPASLTESVRLLAMR